MSATTNLLTFYTTKEPHLVTNEILQELTYFASQSITAPIENKDRLFNLFYNTIYSGYFDDLDGGLVIDETQVNLISSEQDNIYSSSALFYKPLAINISLCRLLFSAGRVFYNGEFRELANKTLEYLCSLLKNFKQHEIKDVAKEGIKEKKAILSRDSYFKISVLAFSFSKSIW